MLYTLFDKQIEIKEKSCNRIYEEGKNIVPSVNVFVKVTNGCNARCAFCSNQNSLPSGRHFDTEKLMVALKEIRRQGILVNRLNITGGEPSTVPAVVKEILQQVEANGFDDIHVHLNTNGLTAESQALMKEPRWDSISCSLHHYDIQKLAEIYGIKLKDNCLDFEGIDRQKINVSCNLIKGYIDCKEEVKKMLDFTLSLNIKRIGFVALMKVNKFCEEHYVDINEVGMNDIPHLYFTLSMNRGADCKCSNYLYNNGLKVLEVYMRNYMNFHYCESSLVYDGNYLRQGFHSDNIVY